MRKVLPLIIAVALTAGCNVIYRQPVYQGVLIEQKNVEQLKEGMTRQQVLSLLGSPSVADPFHHSRWDYVATERYKRNPSEVKIMSVWFENDVLSKWEGEYFPEHNAALRAQARKFGNLPKQKDKDKRR